MAPISSELAFQFRQQSSEIAGLRQNIIDLTAALQSYRTKLTQHDVDIGGANTTLAQLERGLSRFQQEGQAVRLEVDSVRRRAEELSDANRKAQEAIAALTTAPAVSQSAGTIKNIDDVPGFKTPYWYCVDIPVVAGAQVESVVTGSAEISPEGPFVITQIVPWFQITDDGATLTQFNGRVVPCSAGGPIMNQIGGINFGNTESNITSMGNLIPELQFQIEISGSGRYWTNQFLPAAAFYGWPQPLFTGIMGWVETTDRVKIHVSPLRAVPAAGIVRFIMHGFQILNPNVRLSRVLGFGST